VLLSDLDVAVPALCVHPLIGQLVTGTWPAPPARPPATDSGPESGAGSESLPGADRPFVAADDAPDPVLSVLPLDPAQRCAAQAVRRGESLVVHGPPGTGRTQTLAAAVLALVESGKRVLVVTPHRSSAQSLAGRLRGAGLGDLLLDLHDGCGDQNAVLAALGDDLEAADTGSAVEHAERALAAAGDGEVAAVVAATAVLADASRALHAVRSPWGVSAYDAMEALAALGHRPRAVHPGAAGAAGVSVSRHRYS
jgi:hypothetical protein